MHSVSAKHRLISTGDSSGRFLSYLWLGLAGWLLSLRTSLPSLHQVWLTAGWPGLASTRPHKVSSIIHSGMRWIGHKVSAAAGIRSVCLNFLFLFRPSMSWFHAWNYPSLSLSQTSQSGVTESHGENLLTFGTTEAVKQVGSDSWHLITDTDTSQQVSESVGQHEG